MMLKTLIKVGVVAGAVAAGIAAARKLGLPRKAAKVFDQVTDKLAVGAESAIANTVVLVDKGLTWIDEKTGGATGPLLVNDDTPDTDGMREAEESASPARTPMGYGEVTHDGQGAGTR